MSAYQDHLLEAAIQAYVAAHYQQAETILRMLLGRGRNDAHGLYFIGHLACLQGRFEDAMWFLTRSLRMNPDNARAHNDLGEALRALGHNEAALPHLKRAIALEPSLPSPYATLATILVTLNRPEEALPWAQKSLLQTTEKPAAHCALGGIFGRLNRMPEAIEQYDLALALQPDNPSARYFRGLMRLTLGMPRDAWAEHEARLELPKALSGTRAFPRPRWNGKSDLAGRTILLHAEQGFGDTIQFVRYVPYVEARGASVLLEVQRGLGTLCGALAKQVFEAGDPLPDYDLHCSLMSLPAAFDTDMASIPSTLPYLFADPAIRAVWTRKLGPPRKMRVGLAWSGNPDHAADRGRSLPLSALAPLLQRVDIECHVLQRDIRQDDRQRLADFPGLINHSPALTDFAQTAGLLAGMDLLITVDTAVAHLAGAMNVPAWVMLAHAADWRWMRQREDSPWYPSLRLFRQTRRGDWQSLLDAVLHALGQWPPSVYEAPS